MADPTPHEALRRVIDSRLLDVHTSLPGRIEKYDAATQTADVLPMVKNVIADPDGAESEEQFPVIPSVPVEFPRGGGYLITFPLRKGDFVRLSFCEKSIDQFMAKGDVVHPVDLEKHGFSGAVAYAGFYPTDKALSEAGLADGMLMGKEGGPQIFIDENQIELGGRGAGDKVPLDSKLQTELAGIKASLENIYVFLALVVAHSHAAFGAPAAPPLVLGSQSYSPATTGSARVTVDK